MNDHSTEKTMTPRTPEQNQAIQAESKAKIVETALKLFAENGYDATSIRMIAQAAGISQGLMYNYFGSKADLLAEIMHLMMVYSAEAWDNIPHNAPPLDQLKTLIRNTFAELQKREDFWRVFYSLRYIPAFEAVLGDQIINATAALRHVFFQFYKEANLPDAERRAYALYAMVEGIIQQYLFLGKDYPLQAVVDDAIHLHCTPER